MYSAELITLPKKLTGNIAVHPIVELSLLEGFGSGLIQVVPVALVIECRGEVMSFRLDCSKSPDEQSAV